MGIGKTPKAPDASKRERSRLLGMKMHMNSPLLHPRTGPKTPRGKQKSRLNAIKHGIFAVGIIRSRESEADYRRVVADLFKSFGPEGRLEELLVEKLAMLAWRYRRLLQAEAAEVAVQTKDCEQKYRREKEQAALRATEAEGYILCAITDKNDVALEAAIDSLKAIRLEVREKGLDWARHENGLGQDYGPLVEGEGKDVVAVVRSYRVMKAKGLDPTVPLASRYRDFSGAGKAPQSGTDLPPDAAESIVGMLTEDIEALESMLKKWREQGDNRNQIEEARRLVPWQEAIDRLQRYESSLDRSFDRTLSQLERLQRMRLGQPVLPPIKVDVTS